jgi:hypothetical protein
MLLETWGEFNRVDTKPFDRRYESRSYISATASGNYKKTTIETHRFVTHTFRYVGMDLATAKACAAALREKYRRTYWNWKYTSSSADGTLGGGWAKADSYAATVATVELAHMAGNMYAVDCQVNEETILYRVGAAADIEAAFTAAYGDWQYDGE